MSAAEIAASVWREPEPGMGRSFELSVIFAVGPNGLSQEVTSQVVEMTTADGDFSRVTVARDQQGRILARYIVADDGRWLDAEGQLTSLAENQLTTVSPPAAAALSAAEFLAQPQMATLSELLDSDGAVKETKGDLITVTVDAINQMDDADINDLSNQPGSNVHTVMLSATIDTSAEQLLSWSLSAGPNESELAPVYELHFRSMEELPVEEIDDAIFNTRIATSIPNTP